MNEVSEALEGQVLKVKSIGFANGLDVGFERENSRAWPMNIC